MLTVPEAAKRTGRHPETIRRWIREGRLPAEKVGTQHVIGEADLDALVAERASLVPVGWRRPGDPDWVALVRQVRDAG